MTKHQPPEQSSELASITESEHNLNDWSTQSYTFSKKSFQGPDVRSFDSSISDLGLTENDTHNTQLHLQEDRPMPVPYQISQPIYFDNSLDIDNQSLAPSDFYDSSFVMPQVAVPSTKNSETLVADSDVGYIKILVCGDSGIGKTSLTNMFLRANEIVAVQPVAETEGDTRSICSNIEVSTADEKKSVESDFEFEGLKEIRASTGSKDDSNFDLLDSGADSDVIDPIYNICMVDTIGYGAYMDASAIISPVASYLEQQFQITNSIFSPMQPNTSTLLRILNNGSGAYTHVDICLYIIFNRVKPVDYEYMRSIQHLCNIVPVLIKPDSYNNDQMDNRRYEVLYDLLDNNIDVFGFGHCREDLLEMCRRGNPGVPPFIVSLDQTSNADMLTPFTSMPLINMTSTGPESEHQSSLNSSTTRSSNFQALKDMIFHKGINSIRQSTARKFIKWRSAQLMQGPPFDALNDGTSGSQRDLAMITAPTLTTAESVDRMQQVKQAEVKKINLYIARFISDKRKEMEERMIEQEKQLKKQLDSASYKRRAHLLLAELAKLLLHKPMDQSQVSTIPPTRERNMTSNREQKKWPKPAASNAFERALQSMVQPEKVKIATAFIILLVADYLGPWAYILSICILYCLP
ncbi:hypothetical protein K450DRAFT_202980 [Umbelopsis ramanniana AG]|uniref:Septin-type G domain-containing protein n=1 Tax=Umbelopsis ramanniana AG TaxID=1314678 RepID=A0AAD5DZP0_UMBRA|nr:uncharacterized protein K450DRAFT_202980 [Umbelopsis ramanniana AG]KAI8575323.1 hypothetical protein K450DRAFT_202980 [Umbelopsis ramanniana AG]